MYSGEVLRPSDVHSERVTSSLWGAGFAIRRTDGTPFLVSTGGISDLRNIADSLQVGEAFQRITFYPNEIASSIAGSGFALAFVPAWAKETSFDEARVKARNYGLDFGSKKGWANVPRDAVLFCTLIERRLLPFVGTHDLVHHISDFRRLDWEPRLARAVSGRRTLTDYFAMTPKFSTGTLLLPMALGTSIDLLAQPTAREIEASLEVGVDHISRFLGRYGGQFSTLGALRKIPDRYVCLMDCLKTGDGPLADREVPRILEELRTELIELTRA